MKVGFIGDIVGKPGREVIKKHLLDLRKEFAIDFVIANGENASHGFGLTLKNTQELLSYGIDCLTGGNHTFDKPKDLGAIFENRAILRPHNIDSELGSGVAIFDIGVQKLGVVNMMGVFAMPAVNNPFAMTQEVVAQLHEAGVKTIVIDFHAEATSEKAVMFKIMQGMASVVVGTHTHVGTDDMQIVDGTFFVSDIGLSGCFDGIIGMDCKNPIKKAFEQGGKHFDIPKQCEAIFQMVVVDIVEDKADKAIKIKILGDKRNITTLW